MSFICQNNDEAHWVAILNSGSGNQTDQQQMVDEDRCVGHGPEPKMSSAQADRREERDRDKNLWPENRSARETPRPWQDHNETNKSNLL